LSLPKNIDISKSKYKLSISTTPLLWIEKILSSLAVYPYGCIEQTLSSTMPNAILKKFQDIFQDVWVSKEKINTNLTAGLKRIKSMQTKDGGFWYWQGDTTSDLAITPYVLRSLLEIQDSWIDVEKNMIEKSVSYLEKNYKTAEENTQIEILWALAKYNKWNYRGGKLISLGIQNLTDNFSPEKMDRHNLIAYTYALVLADSNKYKHIIEKNIELLKTKIYDKENYNYSIHYYNALDDRAIFTQLLLDFKYKKSYTFWLITELYNRDWSSYYYSTKTKNDTFMAFVKYIKQEQEGNENTIKIWLNKIVKKLTLWKEKNIYTTELPLNQILKDRKIDLHIENIKWNPIFVTSSIEVYPRDILKVPMYSNGIKIKREIYEVVDDTKLEEKCSWETWNRICKLPAWLKLHTGNIFKKWATYKILLKASFLDKKRRDNLVIEDYLPASFRILNSQFKTNTIATSQATKSWRWNYTENQPWVMMTHAKNIWGDKASYEYFVTPDFAGTFIYPPVTTYLMYAPEIRANGVFRRIRVK